MKLLHALKWRFAYFFLWLEATMLRIDAWLAEARGDNALAADFDCRAYDCERQMQDLRLFRGM